MEPITDVGRNLLVERSQELTARRTRWREWPLWRLLGVIAVFAAIGRFQFGFRLADLRQVPLGVMTVIEVSLVLALVSGMLGAAFVSVFLSWPILLVTGANNRFFDLGEAASARLIRASRPRLRWMLAYAIELAIFLAVFYGGRYCLLRLGARL